MIASTQRYEQAPGYSDSYEASIESSMRMIDRVLSAAEGAGLYEALGVEPSSGDDDMHHRLVRLKRAIAERPEFQDKIDANDEPDDIGEHEPQLSTELAEALGRVGQAMEMTERRLPNGRPVDFILLPESSSTGTVMGNAAVADRVARKNWYSRPEVVVLPAKREADGSGSDAATPEERHAGETVHEADLGTAGLRRYVAGGRYAEVVEVEAVPGVKRTKTEDAIFAAAKALGEKMHGHRVAVCTDAAYGSAMEMAVQRVLGLQYGVEVALVTPADPELQKPYRIGQELKAAVDEALKLLHAIEPTLALRELGPEILDIPIPNMDAARELRKKHNRDAYARVKLNPVHPLTGDPTMFLGELDISSLGYYSRDNSTGPAIPGLRKAVEARRDVALRLAAADHYLQTAEWIEAAFGRHLRIHVDDGLRSWVAQEVVRMRQRKMLVENHITNAKAGEWWTLEQVEAEVNRRAAKPARTSPHLAGAVDLKIIAADGEVDETLSNGVILNQRLTLQPDYYEKFILTPEYEELSEEEQLKIQNIVKVRRLQYHVMTALGFVINPEEIWHFGTGDVLAALIGGYEPYYDAVEGKPPLEDVEAFLEYVRAIEGNEEFLERVLSLLPKQAQGDHDSARKAGAVGVAGTLA